MPKQDSFRDDVSTKVTEASTMVDSILSTFCCNGSYDSLQSYKEEVRRRKEVLKKKKEAQQKEATFRDQGVTEEHGPTVWERLSEIALFFVQGNPPVKFVKCFECSSVDDSEVTTPPVLRVMAKEYDRQMKQDYNSMSPEAGEEINPATSLKPLLLRYVRSGIRLKNGGVVGCSVSDNKSVSQVRAQAGNKHNTLPLHLSTSSPLKKVYSSDARSVACDLNSSKTGMRQVVVRRGGRSGSDKSVATHLTRTRSASSRGETVARRRADEQWTTNNNYEKSNMWKRSVTSKKYEI